MLKDFLAAIRRDEPPPIGVHEGLDYALPGISAVDSASAGGQLVTVPDFRSI